MRSFRCPADRRALELGEERLHADGGAVERREGTDREFAAPAEGAEERPLGRDGAAHVGVVDRAERGEAQVVVDPALGGEGALGRLREHHRRLEGQRARRTAPITGLIEDFAGVAAYMDLSAMRRLLRDVARGRPLGDVTTLANAEIVDSIHGMIESGAGSED